MTIKNVCLCLLLAAGISSCGTGKKLEAANAQIANLQAANGELTTKNKDLENKLAEIQARDEKIAAELKRYVAECQESKEKLMAVQAMLKDEYGKLQALKDKISEALVDLDDKGVNVYYKDGFVYVSMEDNLLYKTGSSALSPKAKEALSPLANVLNSYPDLKIIVMGNTDDQMFKSKTTDNWSLSTERANGVIRALRDDYKINPARMTAAGKGKYNPIADNSTKEGKAKNRRTEIILNPDLEKIWESVQP
ncbi:OmpA family protein [Flavihumibacter petaseus]|uniref:OmpA family protein n=1 Tax=Flavihumibacter petaseus NBRC 106054 TaxID=1220578 RepID=A0A0E9MU69_9BACT|nr:OmpA family protein [Flavihumibacter petaseus]GAO41114.1 OmpA family protein [Flavihumibacter petaseus NBRC 106054]